RAARRNAGGGGEPGVRTGRPAPRPHRRIERPTDHGAAGQEATPSEAVKQDRLNHRGTEYTERKPIRKAGRQEKAAISGQASSPAFLPSSWYFSVPSVPLWLAPYCLLRSLNLMSLKITSIGPPPWSCQAMIPSSGILAKSSS